MPSDSERLILDTRGHKCPVPTLRLRRALQTMPSAMLIELRADDPMARIDIPHFCQSHNLPMPEMFHEDDTASAIPAPYWRFIIRPQS